jgi:hypothetical protein
MHILLDSLFKVMDFWTIFISDAPTDIRYNVLDLFNLNALYALYYVNQ